MTPKEFSSTFDTLLNSYDSKAMFGEAASKEDIVLDEYEKSVLLTQAQDIIVKSYFDKQLNQQGQGFDDSQRRQIDFSQLITVGIGTKLDGTTYDERGILFKMPTIKINAVDQIRVLFPLNERLKVTSKDGTSVESYVVVPVNYKEYDRMMSKAYSQPLKKQCWRLFQNVSGVDIISEIIPIEGVISTDSTLEYKVRYVRRPTPIILTNLTFSQSQGELNIDGFKTVTECELNPILHMDILNKAVEIAYTTRGRRQAQPQQQQQPQQTQ